MNVCMVNWFEGVNVADMDHWPYDITYSAELRNN